MGIDWENIYEKIMYKFLYVKFFDYKQIANNINIIINSLEISDTLQFTKEYDALFRKSEEKNKQIEHIKFNFWMKY